MEKIYLSSKLLNLNSFNIFYINLKFISCPKIIREMILSLFKKLDWNLEIEILENYLIIKIIIFKVSLTILLIIGFFILDMNFLI